VIHRCRTSKGCAQARERGFRAAKAEGADVVVFTDSHMLFPPQWLDRMLAHHMLHPRAILCPISSDLDGPMWGTGADLLFNPTTGIWKAEWHQAHMDIPSPAIPAVMGACYMAGIDVIDALGGWAGGLEGWGLDEEYISARAWLLGYECRLASDVAVAHRYHRPDINREPATGPTDRAWEVLHNHQVLAKVLLSPSCRELYAGIIRDTWPQEPLQQAVDEHLVQNQADIRRMQKLIEKKRTQDDLAFIASLTRLRQTTFLNLAAVAAA